MTDAEKLRADLIQAIYDVARDAIFSSSFSVNEAIDAVFEVIGVPPETLKALANKTWKAVPVTLTSEMITAATKSLNRTDNAIYCAMLAAAPEKPE